MQVHEKLFVEIRPVEGEAAPRPHPVRDARFDPRYIYRVLGTQDCEGDTDADCLFLLANPQRQMWLIPRQHLLAHGLVDSDALFLEKGQAPAAPAPRGPIPVWKEESAWQRHPPADARNRAGAFLGRK